MTRVTVLLPVYNGAAFLRGAVESLLAQTFPDFELLVVDDGSADGSAEIAESYGDPRVRVLRNGANRGLAASLNRGLEEARAPLVARQDADDLSQPERLARQVHFLEGRASVALVGTQAREIDGQGRPVGGVDKPGEAAGIAWTMMSDNAFVHTSVLFRRDVIRGLGGYDPAFVHCQDYDLWERLLRTSAAANLDDRLVSSRLHSGSMTETVQKQWRHQSLEVMRRAQSRALGRALGDEEAELLALIREGVPPADKRRLLALLAALREEFLRRAPDAAGSRDFRRTIARQCGNVLASHRLRPIWLLPWAVARMGLRYPVVPTVFRRARWAMSNRIAGRR